MLKGLFPCRWPVLLQKPVGFNSEDVLMEFQYFISVSVQEPDKQWKSVQWKVCSVHLYPERSGVNVSCFFNKLLTTLPRTGWVRVSDKDGGFNCGTISSFKSNSLPLANFSWSFALLFSFLCQCYFQEFRNSVVLQRISEPQYDILFVLLPMTILQITLKFTGINSHSLCWQIPWVRCEGSRRDKTCLGSVIYGTSAEKLKN